MASVVFCGVMIAIVAVLLIANYIAVTMQERREGKTSEPLMLDAEAINSPEIQTALANGRKVDAIKYYRKLTNAGLKEAKDAIELYLADPDVVREKKKKPAYDSQDAGVRDLIAEGRLDEAAEIYQKFAGVDEYTARDAIADLEDQIRQEGQSSS